jgi:hypothetical protein
MLLGGERGFLGFGVVSRAKVTPNAHVHSAAASPTLYSNTRKVVFCIPFSATTAGLQKEINMNMSSFSPYSPASGRGK